MSIQNSTFYPHFVKHISLPLYEWWHGTDLLKRVKEFERSQWLKQDVLREAQLLRLQAIVEHAFCHSPYYRHLSKQLGITSTDIRSFDDYEQIPSLTKETLQERLNELIVDNILDEEMYRGVTSGSSGRPTFFVQQISTNRIRKAAGRRLMKLAGYDFGLRVFYLWREAPYTIGSKADPDSKFNSKKLHWLFRAKTALHDRFAIDNPIERRDPSLLGEGELQEMYEMIRDFNPILIISYVSALYLLAQYLDATGRCDIRPGSIIVSSETLYPHQKEMMEKVFACKVFNRYGLQEVGIVAVECPIGGGLHVNQEILHLEFDPTDGGDEQLIITDLINYAMPLLRYETGDRVKAITEPCPCGRGLLRIDKVEGRLIDLLPTKFGGIVNGQLFTTFHWIDGIKQYQVIQKKLSSFVIKVVVTDDFSSNNLEPIVKMIHANFGDDSIIDIQYVDAIPFSKGGKYRLVVSEVNRVRQSGDNLKDEEICKNSHNN